MLRAGAAATPVLLSISSGPVAAAGTVNCVVASSFVSATSFKSRNPGTTAVSCGGSNRCEDWQTKARAVPCKESLLNRTVSQCIGNVSACSYVSTPTYCKAVMGHASGIMTSSELGVVQHVMALILNFESGTASIGNPAFNKTYLQGVLQNYYANGRSGYKLPAAGINWSEAQLIAWLRVMLQYNLP